MSIVVALIVYYYIKYEKKCEYFRLICENSKSLGFYRSKTIPSAAIETKTAISDAVKNIRS